METPKIKTATALRNDLYETLKEVSEGQTHIITHKQGDPVVLLSKRDYDKHLDEKEFLRKTAIGLAQIENGEGIPHSEVVKKFEALKKQWK